MEVEQEFSRFVDQGEGIFSTRDLFGAPQKRPVSRFLFPDDSDDVLRKAAGLSYRWLDSLAGIESYAFAKPDPRERKPYGSILRFLRAQGMVEAVYYQETRHNDAPRFHRFDINPAYPPGSTDRPRQWSFARASGKDPDEVLSKTIGEFLERYFLTLYRKTRLVRASPAALRKKRIAALDLARLAGFSEEQKESDPNRQWNEESVFYWEKAICVTTGAEIYVPSQLIYWNYAIEPPEPVLRERNTNSAGGYFSREGAILSGLYELIQRDAFLIYWLNAQTPSKVDPESVSNETFQQILRESKRYGFEIHCLNTTLDTGVPSAVVVVEDLAPTGFGIAMGGGCGLNLAGVLLDALQEAWSVVEWMRRQEHGFNLPVNYQPFSDRAFGQNERILLWTNPAIKPHMRFFLSGEATALESHVANYPSRFSSEKEELAFLVTRVEELGPGYEVYAYVSRHPALKQLGYASSRVIVPQLIPLYLNESDAPLGAERLRSVPQKLGWGRERAFNPWPHPFP